MFLNVCISTGLTATFCHVLVKESPLPLFMPGQASLRHFERRNALFHLLSGGYQLATYLLELQGDKHKAVMHSHLS